MSNAEDGLNEFLRDCSWDEGAATCAAVWKRGHLELLCNDRFASMYIGRLAMEKDLVDGDIGPASIWSRCVPTLLRSGIERSGVCLVWIPAADPGGYCVCIGELQSGPSCIARCVP